MTSLDGAAPAKALIGFAMSASVNQSRWRAGDGRRRFIPGIPLYFQLSAPGRPHKAKNFKLGLRACPLRRVGLVDETAFIEAANDAVVDDAVDLEFADFRTSQRHQT